MLRYQELHENARQWFLSIRQSLVGLVAKAITSKQESSASFVKLLFSKNEDGKVEKICREDVCGCPDVDEDIMLICRSNQEYLRICQVYDADIDGQGNLSFGEMQLNLRQLCGASIFLSSARYTASLLALANKVETWSSGSSTSEHVPGESSRVQVASKMIDVLGKWVQVRCFAYVDYQGAMVVAWMFYVKLFYQ